MSATYAVVAADGTIQDVVHGTQTEAVRVALRDAPEVVVDQSFDYEQPEANPELDPKKATEIAVRAIRGLHIDGDKAEAMSMQEAFGRLKPFFAKLRRAGRSVQVWKWPGPQYGKPRPEKWKGCPGGMSAHLLTQNYKSMKGHPEQPSHVFGLSLLPNVVFSDLEGHVGRKINTCVGASPECRRACLVYSGNNRSNAYILEVQQAKMAALFSEPVAFGKMLLENCRLHKGNSPGPGEPRTTGGHLTPFVRLNVFSDIPWEAVFPDLFDLGLSYYDYSKVPGRKPPPNYSLTFSYSGRNLENARREVKRGNNVSVVFLRTKAGRKYELPKTFFGRPVIDGDLSDVRPLDPGRVIVGLRYKVPLGQAYDPENSLFVVQVHEVDGELTAAVVPRDQPGVVASIRKESELVQLAANTARLRRSLV